MDDLITTKEAATLLGYRHSESIHGLRKSRADFPEVKKIVPFKQGRRMLFSRNEILAWGDNARKEGFRRMHRAPAAKTKTGNKQQSDSNAMALWFITRPRVASL